MQSMSFLYSSSQVSLAMIEELRATIKKQELEMKNLKDHLDKVVRPFFEGVHTAQCGNFMIFLSLRFYVKTILENLEVQNLLF